MSTSEFNPEIETLLSYIKRNRGFDFTGYKRSTLNRRVNKRMQSLAIDSYSDYLDYLEVHPEEFVQLFNTILINVTSFFRDRSVWDYLSTEIIHRLIAGKEPLEPIRIWSAGCASGQEAYTLAILLAEALGVEQFRERVKIYATDMDEEALHQARQAIYSAKEVADIPPELLAQYFEHSNSHYTFRKDLRRSVIFGRHNLVGDAPISRINLLVCRNTLMYFNAETQANILDRFHFAMTEGGFLLLGKAEMLLSHSNSFAPVDLKLRIFTKMPKGNVRDRLFLTVNNNDEEEVNLARHLRIREAAFDATPTAQLLVEPDGLLMSVNEKARSLFGLKSPDLGSRPFQDLELSYRPVDLRSCIDQAYAERRAVTLSDVEWATRGGDTQYFDVQVTPLWSFSGSVLGVSITFTDVTRSKRLQAELEQSNQELEMAYEELQSTNEELETTNEELQSSNEELQTTNEELQSTNEELETMNEELQSSNEELQTINAEVRKRTDELNSVNAFLQSILNSLRGGVVVLNTDLLIQIWNHEAEELWGLRAEEMQGQYFLNLDIGLPVEQLRQPLRKCLLRETEYVEVTLSATNRRGKAIDCKITCTPLRDMANQTCGVIMIMEQQ